MINKQNTVNSKEKGIVLLITLVLVSAILSIGITMIDLSVKQIKLSDNSKGSEVAFTASDAGSECAQFWRRRKLTDMSQGQSFSANCFGGSTNVVPNTSSHNAARVPVLSGSSVGSVYLYEYEFTWGDNNDRCSKIRTLVGKADIAGNGIEIVNISSLVDNYPYSGNKICQAGETCSVISVSGYNKACSLINNNYGVVQRQVYLEL